MSIGLDGQMLFDKQDLKIETGSVNRDSVERAVSGLDGVLSIDLGGRSRRIKQKGVLRATSRAELNSKASAISAFIDGRTHTLVLGGNKGFDNIRMDSFKVTEERASGSGIVVSYEIVYTQLVV